MRLHRLLVSLFLLNTGALTFADSRAAFVTFGSSSFPSFPTASTRGAPVNLLSQEAIVITHLGVWDFGSDGLASSHEVGIWRHQQNDLSFLASTTVPAGTAGLLRDGYRYSAITPVLIPPAPFRGLVVGGHYSANDPDDIERPNVALSYDPPILAGFAGRYAVGPTLTIPQAQLGPGIEGQGNYRFYHANFLFEPIPEPSTSALLACGLVLLMAGKRRQR